MPRGLLTIILFALVSFLYYFYVLIHCVKGVSNYVAYYDIKTLTEEAQQ